MEDAAELVASVRDDPAARLALAARFYDTRVGGHDVRRYRRAEIAFMEWQIRRGVLAGPTGSGWWRAVNEGLLLDAWTAERALSCGGPSGDRRAVDRWIEFLREPSPRSWYRAHNTSIVAGYVAHRGLIDAEAPLERFFMDVALLRVLFAGALLSEPRLALGRFAAFARFLVDPRNPGTGAFLSMRNIVPNSYPMRTTELDDVLSAENRLGHVLDYGVILPRAQGLYEHAARDLGIPELLGMIHDGRPAYAWPPGDGHAWISRWTTLCALATRCTR